MTTSPRRPLPQPLTSFVGRAPLHDARSRLSATRLLTLIGPGGSGKSRLALALAERVRRAFPDGICLVPLAALPRTPTQDQPSAVTATVTDALAAALALPPHTPLADIAEHLADATALVILDDCEHLADACATVLTTLLAHTRTLRVLATSQHILGVAGERTLPLPLLTDPTTDAEGADATHADAITLFHDRATAAGATLPTDPAGLATISAICHHLDGLPLGIERAAEATRTLALTDILTRLRADRLDPLIPSRHDVPARQQSLLAALEHSASLCTPAERALWASLSVCEQGFDLATAIAIAPDEAAASSESSTSAGRADAVVALLAQLVSKSILRREDARGAATARYRMPATTRAYGRRLLTSTAGQDTRQRHAEHVLNHTADADPTNLAAAFDTLLPTAPQDALRLAVTAVRDHRAATWTDRAATRGMLCRATAATAATPTPQRAEAFAWASWSALWIGDVTAAHADLVAAGPASTCDSSAAGVLLAVGAYRGLAQADPLAIPLLCHAYDHLRTEPQSDPVPVLLLPVTAALVAAFTATPGQPAGIAVPALPSDAPPWLVNWAAVPTALARASHGNPVPAHTALRLACAKLWRLGDPPATTWALLALAWLDSTTGRHEQAAHTLGAAAALQRARGFDLSRLALFTRVTTTITTRARDALGRKRFHIAYDTSAAFGAAQAVQAITRSRTTRTKKPAATSSPLTTREYEVFACLAEGMTYKDAGSALVISERTVETHAQNARRKLGVDTNAQVIHWISRQSTDHHENPE